MIDEIVKQIQPMIVTAIGLVITWALGEVVRFLRAKVAAATADGNVAKSKALELAANAAVAAAEEMAAAAEKRGEAKPDGAGKMALARALLPPVDELTAQRVLAAAVARTFGAGATGAQTVGRAPSVALQPASAGTAQRAALTTLAVLAAALAGCSGAAVAWPASCSPSKSGVILCVCKTQTVKVTRDAAGTIKRVEHFCDGDPLPIDSRAQEVKAP